MVNLAAKNGHPLPESAIHELRSLPFEVVLGGEAIQSVYQAAINRYNKAWVLESVRCPRPFSWYLGMSVL